MYPRILINRKSLNYNARIINEKCKKNNIKIAGVTKVLCGLPQLALEMKKAGIEIIADSRIQNIKRMKEAGINSEFMLIRIPMISELEEVVKNVDYCLVSDFNVIKKMSEFALKNNKIQKIIYMIDLGDLREGIWFQNVEDDFEEICNLNNIEVFGIGTNLGCFGGVKPTKENMNTLVKIKLDLEEKYNIKIKMISAGSTVTLPLLEKNVLPKEVNNFRIGEAIVCGFDATNNFEIKYLKQDTVILETEVLEVFNKPSKPFGEIGRDAFGRKPKFEDLGNRKKAILAIGEQDILASGLKPLDKKITVLHASSDHTIIDITDCDISYKSGDIIKFKMSYGCLLRTSTSKYVEKVII